MLAELAIRGHIERSVALVVFEDAIVAGVVDVEVARAVRSDSGRKAQRICQRDGLTLVASFRCRGAVLPDHQVCRFTVVEGRVVFGYAMVSRVCDVQVTIDIDGDSGRLIERGRGRARRVTAEGALAKDEASRSAAGTVAESTMIAKIRNIKVV